MSAVFGDPRLPDRFWAKVVIDDSGCWLWTGAVHKKTGYSMYLTGSKRDGSRRMSYAHRVIYLKLVGPISDGLQIDHVKKRGCKHRHCVNPDHLEPVTPLENVRRGDSGSNMRNRTHCPKGHFYDEANTHIRSDRPGHRECRECRRAYDRKYMARKRANAVTTEG